MIRNGAQHQNVPIEHDAAVSKEAEGSNGEDDTVFTGEATLNRCSQRVIAADATVHFPQLAANIRYNEESR